jgi:hypothetical protein
LRSYVVFVYLVQHAMAPTQAAVLRRKIFYPKNSKQAEWFTGTIKIVALKKGCNPETPNYV